VIGSEPELRRAEVRCDRLDANECMRVADAYESGKVVQANSEQVARYRKISLTLYVHQSQNGDAVACFQLARLYQTGELVTKNRENAQVLLQRCGELCARKNDEACRYIRKRAGADKPANRHE
jgi:TPR repeat protein